MINNPQQPLHASNSFKNTVRYFERGLSKSLKKDLIFVSNPVPFNGQDYEKQKGLGASIQLFFRLQSKFRKIPLFVMYYLTKFDEAV